MATKHCSECAYFEEKAADDTGLCRFNPPVSQPAPDSQGLWPVVKGEDWCGHFERDAA